MPEFKIVSTEENGNDIVYNVEPIAPNTDCPDCGSTNTVSNGSYNRFVRDLNCFDKHVGIRILGTKHKCKDCGHVFVEEYESIENNRRITVRLKEKIRADAAKHKFSAIAEDYCITNQTVKNIFIEYVSELDTARVIKAPRVLGIDEAHIKNSECATFVDVESSMILEILDNRKKNSVMKFIESFEDSENIKVVTMDMCRSYKEAVQEVLPYAAIVVDRFHVIKNLNKIVDDFRIEFFKTNCKPEERHTLPIDTNTKMIKGALLSNADNLTGKQIMCLDRLFTDYPVFNVLYDLKEAFRLIYDCNDKKEAQDMYAEWKKQALSSFPGFKPFIKTVENWHDEIFNFFDGRYSNGIVERINGKIKEIYRAGHGYSFDVLRFKVLYGTSATRKAVFSFNKSGMVGSSYIASINSLFSYGPKLESGFGVSIDELHNIIKRNGF